MRTDDAECVWGIDDDYALAFAIRQAAQRVADVCLGTRLTVVLAAACPKRSSATRTRWFPRSIEAASRSYGCGIGQRSATDPTHAMTVPPSVTARLRQHPGSLPQGLGVQQPRPGERANEVGVEGVRLVERRQLSKSAVHLVGHVAICIVQKGDVGIPCDKTASGGRSSSSKLHRMVCEATTSRCSSWAISPAERKM